MPFIPFVITPFVPTVATPAWSPILAQQATFQELSKVAHANGDTVTFADGTNPDVVFEYRVTAGSVGAGNIKLDISAATSAADVVAITAPLFLTGGLRLSTSAIAGTTVVWTSSLPADPLPYTVTTLNVLNTVTNAGVMTAPTGSTTLVYKAVGVNLAADGVTYVTTAASTQISHGTGPATLSALNLARITWTDPLNCTHVDIWITADNSTRGTVGKIARVAVGVQTLDDIGAAVVTAGAPPTINTTGVGKPVYVGKLSGCYVQAGGTYTGSISLQLMGSIPGGNPAPTTDVAGTAGNGFVLDGAAITSASTQAVAVATAYEWLRCDQTHAGSGVPTMFLGGRLAQVGG